MHFPKTTSLRRLLLTHEFAFLLLVIVTGLLGGLWAYFWQQSSAELVRINQLYYAAQQIRGDLFRQIKEVYLARLMERREALTTYSDYSRSIDAHFNTLRRHSVSRAEDQAVQAMQHAYRVIQKDMNNIFSDPYLVSRVVRIRILDPAEEKDFVSEFEAAFKGLESLVRMNEQKLETSMERWTTLAPLLIPIPILLAAALLLFSRHSVRRDFVRPMGGITDGARRISEGDLNHQISVQGVEETRELARAINEMAARLATSQAALVESERQAALGSLVPVVAHNIRNPLATIRASAQLLDEGSASEEISDVKASIIETVDRLGRWVSALVSYLHPLKPAPIEAKPAAMVDAAFDLLSLRMQERDLRLEKSGWDESACVRADPDLMEQAFYSILSNAVDASPDGAAVRVGICREGRDLLVSIEDEGIGMPFQPEPGGLTPGPSTKRFGTGLGIPVAYKVCKAHGWQLEFTKSAHGGTRVEFRAPVAEESVRSDA